MRELKARMEGDMVGEVAMIKVAGWVCCSAFR